MKGILVATILAALVALFATRQLWDLKPEDTTVFVPGEVECVCEWDEATASVSDCNCEEEE